MLNKNRLVHSFLHQSAENYPENIALVHNRERVSYRTLYSRSEKICQWLLQQGIQKGDRVILLTDHPGEYIASYFGILAAGGIVVCLNTQLSDRELDYFLSDSEASIVLSQQRYKRFGGLIKKQRSVTNLETDIPSLWGGEAVGEFLSLPKIDSEDIAQIIYTSGTTGKPKGVMLRHRNLVANTISIISYLELSRHDKVMMVLPFFYSYGNSVMLSHVAVGSTLVVNQSFCYPNVIFEQMVKERVTVFCGVASTYTILLQRSSIRDYTFPSLRYITQAGSSMSKGMVEKLSKVFCNTKLYIMYGQTEAGPRLSYLAPEWIDSRAGSVGKAVPGVELEVCRPDGSRANVREIGEIVATGENIMAGYWRLPEETAKVLKNGKLWTGDMAWVDEDGFFFIVGRNIAIIKSGSHRIAPGEIEEIIQELSAIEQVEVIGVPHDILGEAILAVVLLKKDCELSEDQVRQYCYKNLPAYKIPHKVEFRESLPKTDTGKVKFVDLKKRLGLI